jgi:bacteriorhodopsin
MRASFTITYALLFTTGTITLVEALRTKVPSVRHIMNLETCVSLVAAFFYSQFIKKLDSFDNDASREDERDLYKSITETRYVDWCITTPMMLLVLCLVLAHNHGSPLSLGVYAAAVALNWAMLASGYLGETGAISKFTGGALGFAFFAGLVALVFFGALLHSSSSNNTGTKTIKTASYVVFGLFASVWSLYGVAYMLDDERTKNLSYNILDAFSKCLIGIGLWAYFCGIFH